MAESRNVAQACREQYGEAHDIDRAHEDGRHAGRHPADIGFWVRRGCTGCAATHTATGLRKVAAA